MEPGRGRARAECGLVTPTLHAGHNSLAAQRWLKRLCVRRCPSAQEKEEGTLIRAVVCIQRKDSRPNEEGGITLLQVGLGGTTCSVTRPTELRCKPIIPHYNPVLSLLPGLNRIIQISAARLGSLARVLETSILLVSATFNYQQRPKQTPS